MDDLFEVVVVSVVFFVDPCLFLSACVMGILEDARVYFCPIVLWERRMVSKYSLLRCGEGKFNLEIHH